MEAALHWLDYSHALPWPRYLLYFFVMAPAANDWEKSDQYPEQFFSGSTTTSRFTHGHSTTRPEVLSQL